MSQCKRDVDENSFLKFVSLKNIRNSNNWIFGERSSHPYSRQYYLLRQIAQTTFYVSLTRILKYCNFISKFNRWTVFVSKNVSFYTTKKNPNPNLLVTFFRFLKKNQNAATIFSFPQNRLPLPLNFEFYIIPVCKKWKYEQFTGPPKKVFANVRKK